MNLLIDKNKLKLLIREYKDDIGNNKWKEQISNFIVLLFTFFASDFRSIWVIRKEFLDICYIIYMIILLIGCVKSVKKVIKDNVTADKLIDEIVALDDQQTSNHTIIMIKDKYNYYSNKFLLYYDVRWKCKLFLNIKTDKDKKENERKIIEYVSNKLHIEKNKIEVKYKIEHIHTKFSNSDKINKKYRHEFYEVNISYFPEELRKNKFVIDKIKYQWMTIEQMWADKTIKQYNTDIVGYVRDIYA